MTALTISIFVLVVALLAEGLHARRIVAVRLLLFASHSAGTLRLLLGGIGAWRAIALGGLAWGMTTLLLIPPANTAADDVDERIDPARLQRLVLLLDVSPSMALPDAGGDPHSTRAKRAADVIMRALSTVDLKRCRVSIVAFYTGAKPVVIDTIDPNVVRNVVDGLPLTDAFDDGQTDLLSGIKGAFDLASGWNPHEASLMIVSDGDSVPTTGMPTPPTSIDRVFVVGVGDPQRGAFIDGHMSRQEAGGLHQIAARLGGIYLDANVNDLPSTLLSPLSGLLPASSAATPWDRRGWALLACAISAVLLLLLPWAGALIDRVMVVLPVVSRRKEGERCVAA